MDTIERAIKELGATAKAALATGQPREKSTDAKLSTGERPSKQPREGAFKEEREAVRRSRAATLNRETAGAAGILIPDASRSRIKEEYRRIKRPLLLNALGKGVAKIDHPNLIMVTSARAGEGKTFTALNLALSIASERDRTVLLVDADVVKPSLHRYFEVADGPGLVDLLVEDSLDFGDILIDTDVPKLSLALAGSVHHLSTELLASGSMRELANEMSERYSDRVIVFDSPPLLVTTEASVLASLVGQIVMVVEAERTLRSDVEDALSVLGTEATVGVVVNKSVGKDLATRVGGEYSYGRVDE